MTVHFTYGCDPELFLKLGDRYISAHGLFPGTKEEPYQVDKGAIQVDGLALEFNIHPVDNPVDWNKNIEIVLTQMKEMVTNVDKDLQLVFEPIAYFDKQYFEEVPIVAKVLGCDPDFNFRGEMNPSPKIAKKPFRTAAGHIHAGWGEGFNTKDSGHFEDCRFVAAKFYRAGVFPAVTFNEQSRLEYYGNYGAFRPKPYGVELRSPSNLWVKDAESRLKMFSKVHTKMLELEA